MTPYCKVLPKIIFCRFFACLSKIIFTNAQLEASQEVESSLQVVKFELSAKMPKFDHIQSYYWNVMFLLNSMVFW